MIDFQSHSRENISGDIFLLVEAQLGILRRKSGGTGFSFFSRNISVSIKLIFSCGVYSGLNLSEVA